MSKKPLSLDYKFKVGRHQVTFVVPPLRGGLLRIFAYWDPPMPKELKLTDDETKEYIAGRDGVLNGVMELLGMGGKRLPYEVLHDTPHRPTVLGRPMQ